jgi:hypothetical protein
MTKHRFDEADSYFIEQELTKLDPQNYYHLVPGVVGRRHIPTIAAASPNMPSYKYTMVKFRGSTKKSGPKSKDAPSIEVIKDEKVHTIKTFEEEASWTLDEVRAAREAGHSLDSDKILGAITKIEQHFDEALCTGIAGTTATGLANNADIDDTNAADKGSGQTSWLHANADPDEIIADVRTLIADASTALKQAQVPGSDMPMFSQFTLFLPLSRYNHIDMRPRSSTSDTTILDFIKKFSALKAVIPWWRLDTANGGNPMAVLVPALDNGAMNPLAGGALLPMDFERVQEQYSGRTVTVPCAGKCGGVPIRYPVAFRYLKLL